MKISYQDEKRNLVDINSNKIIIELNEDVSYHISINKFGELLVQKQQYGNGDSAILLKPSVSNEIKLS